MTLSVRALIVGGGGPGGGSSGPVGSGTGGGGGGGGEVFDTGIENLVLPPGDYPIVVGARTAFTAANEEIGKSSSAFGKTALGGGTGGGATTTNVSFPAKPGGSGGGGRAFGSNEGGSAGAPGPNVNGISGTSYVLAGRPGTSGSTGPGGGGGGAGAIGSGKNGGNGYLCDIRGLDEYFGAGGGGGASASGSTAGGTGGLGGGGAGGNRPGFGGNGSGFGAGGGGAGSSTNIAPGAGAGYGNFGIVIIRYAGTTVLASGGIIDVGDDFVTHTFEENGTFQYSPPMNGDLEVVLPMVSAESVGGQNPSPSAAVNLSIPTVAALVAQDYSVNFDGILPLVKTDGEVIPYFPDLSESINPIYVRPFFIDVGVVDFPANSVDDSELILAQLSLPKIQASSSVKFIYDAEGGFILPAMSAASLVEAELWIEAAITLPKMSLSSEAEDENIDTQGEMVLPSFVIEVEALQAPYSIVDVTLPSISLDAFATRPIFAEGENALPRLFTEGEAWVEIWADGSSTLPKMTASSIVYQTVAGTIDAIIPSMEASSLVLQAIEMGGIYNLPSLSFIGLVNSDHPEYDPIANIVLPKISVMATVNSPIGIVGAMTLPSLSVAVEADIPIWLISSSSLPRLDADATVFQSAEANGVISLPKITLASIGGIDATGQIGLTMPSLDLNAQLGYPVVVDSNFSLPRLRASALVKWADDNQGLIVLPMLVVAGEITVDNLSEATGDLILPSMQVSLEMQAENRINGSLSLPLLRVSARLTIPGGDGEIVSNNRASFTSGFIGIRL